MSKINFVFQNYNINIKAQYISTNNQIGYCVSVIDETDIINNLFLSINDITESIKTFK